jgi:translation elongation factor P/translation initiation factor 5A
MFHTPAHHHHHSSPRNKNSGMTIELDGEPYKVLNFSIMKQARGAAKTTIKMKNLMRSTTIENTYRSGEKFETAEISKTDAQFTYKEGVRIVLFGPVSC